jgi:uncharacterized membrane-anchored protein YhcB (DUF1043 family)
MDYSFTVGAMIGFGVMTYKSMRDIKKIEEDLKKLKTEIDLKKYQENKKLESIKEILSWN